MVKGPFSAFNFAVFVLALSLLVLGVACQSLDPNKPIPLNNPPTSNPTPSTPAPPPPSATLQSSVNHIVYILQQNRSFDMYLGKINDYRAAHGLPTDVDGLPANVQQESFDGKRLVPAFKMLS